MAKSVRAELKRAPEGRRRAAGYFCGTGAPRLLPLPRKEKTVSDCHIFGPVGSSRLGRSLGLDPLDEKRCTFDCLYCEVGPCPERVVKRDVFVPTAELMAELRAWRGAHSARPDHVTISGSGEPCLHLELERLIHESREVVPGVPVAVLTNSSLLPDPQVRAELAAADVVLPSMDTLVEREFQILDRPHESVRLADVARGLLDFREQFQGSIFLEVFLSEGINDSEENLALLEDYVKRLRPERVDVVTLSRPGAYAKGRAARPETLRRFGEVLGAAASVKAGGGTDRGAGIALRHALGQEENVCAPSVAAAPGNDIGAAPGLMAGLAEEVFQSLRRRPQTAGQLADALERTQGEVDEAIGVLLAQKRARALPGNEPPFFKAV